jgi:hypothetical protein
MAEKLQQTSQQPIVKIGHYTLGQTLGVGTFGKVKSKCRCAPCYLFVILCCKGDIAAGFIHNEMFGPNGTVIVCN